MEIRDVTETLSAKPTGEAVTTLQEVLQKYPDNTEAKAGLGAIESLNENPIKVFENAYTQTPDSIHDLAGDVRHQRNQRRLAEKTVPRILLIVGALMAVGGALYAGLVGKRRHPKVDPAVAKSAAAAAAMHERDSVSMGSEPDPAPLTADPPGSTDAPSPVDAPGTHVGSIGLDTTAVNEDDDLTGGADTPARPEA
jgi:hypothetical protein